MILKPIPKILVSFEDLNFEEFFYLLKQKSEKKNVPDLNVSVPDWKINVPTLVRYNGL